MSDGGGSCWQYDVKRQLELASSNLCGAIDAKQTVVRQIDFRVARDFIEQFEWLGNIGSSQVCYGLFFGEHLLAVSCYARSAAPTGFVNLLPEACPSQIYQLCRGATAPHSPKWAGSRVVSASLRLLRRRVGAQYVVAYADPRAGEIGVVYQAANAVYLGLTDARGPGEYLINGELLNPRTVYRRFGTARHEVLVRIDPAYSRFQRVKKYRYVFVLGAGKARRHLASAISAMARPYPKRPIAASMEPFRGAEFG